MFQTTALFLLRACRETGVRLTILSVRPCPFVSLPASRPSRATPSNKSDEERDRIEAWWKGDGGRKTFWLTAPSSQSRAWNADEVHVNQEQCSLFSSYSIFISLPPFPPYTNPNSLSLFLLFKRKYTRNPHPLRILFLKTFSSISTSSPS
jgi:hypothetical protein